MKKAYFILLSLSVFFFAYKSSIEPPGEQFKKQWYSGKAELTSYTLQQARYGEMRNGESVLIFVTEDFSKEKLTELSDIIETSRQIEEQVFRLIDK